LPEELSDGEQAIVGSIFSNVGAPCPGDDLHGVPRRIACKSARPYSAEIDPRDSFNDVIIDSQIHVWGAPTSDRPWPLERAGEPPRLKPFSAEEALNEMDCAGVDAAVLIPPSWEGDRNDLALAAARKYPHRFGVMGRLFLGDPSSIEALRRWWLIPGLLGFRFSFHTPALRKILEDPSHDFWTRLEESGAPVMLLLPDLALHAGPLAESHPSLRITLDHLGLSIAKRGPTAFDKLDDLLFLARYSNVSVKASALPCYVEDPWPHPSLVEPLKRVLDTFGPARVFWGSDLARLPCTYSQWIGWAAQMLPLAAADLAALMGDSLCDWFRWRPSRGVAWGSGEAPCRQI
jgi:L-fuconolactonase